MDTLQVNVEHLRQRAGAGFTTVTELADTLVRRCNLSFRQAHSIVSALVTYAQDEGLSPGQLTTNMLSAAAKQVGMEITLSAEEFERALDPRAFVDARTLPGGAAASATAAVLDVQRGAIERDRQWLRDCHVLLASADLRLQDAVTALRE